MAIRFLFSLYFLCLFVFFCEKFGRCPSRPKIVIRHVCYFTTEGHKYMLPIEGVKMALIPLLISNFQIFLFADSLSVPECVFVLCQAIATKSVR